MSLTGKARTIGWHEHRCDCCATPFWNTIATVEGLDLCGDCTYREDQRAIQENEVTMYGTDTRSVLR